MGIPRCKVHRRCFSAIRPTSAPNAAEPLDALRRRAATAALCPQLARRCTAEAAHSPVTEDHYHSCAAAQLKTLSLL